MSHTPGPNKKGTHWNKGEEIQMKSLAKGNTPTPLIANILGRTTSAVQSKANELGVTLKPVNKPPYNRRKL